MRWGWLSGTMLAAMALAGAAAAEPSSANLALAQRYARAIHMENILGSMMNNLMPLLIDRAAAARGTTVTAALEDAMARAAETSARRMAPRMLDVMTPVLLRASAKRN
ncbi:hypothetical protein [Phenylobacterium sp.]|uniref:hypothetical protein n=1 Tax=Phenylobacterium sp. TaxID=1871053 RepID=UPI0025E6EDDD|nr:hypothetical protein [Phenylobacterium sp.]